MDHAKSKVKITPARPYRAVTAELTHNKLHNRIPVEAPIRLRWRCNEVGNQTNRRKVNKNWANIRPSHMQGLSCAERLLDLLCCRHDASFIYRPSDETSEWRILRKRQASRGNCPIFILINNRCTCKCSHVDVMTAWLPLLDCRTAGAYIGESFYAHGEWVIQSLTSHSTNNTSLRRRVFSANWLH